MSGTIVVLLLVFLALAVVWLSSRSAPARQRQRNAAVANSLVSQAEIKIQSGDDVAAEAMYIRALALAEQSADKLLCAECYYGLARVEQARRDYKVAARMLEFALNTAPTWRDEKPNFERLLQRELQRMQEKQKP